MREDSEKVGERMNGGDSEKVGERTDEGGVG